MEVSIEQKTKHNERLNGEDKALFAEYGEKLDKVKKNIDQGEFGRAMAESRTEEIKTIFASIQSNIAEESNFLAEQAKEVS